jgi:lysophospholipase L1-like esterase
VRSYRLDPMKTLKKIGLRLLLFSISALLSLFFLEVAARLLLPQPAFDTQLPLYPYFQQERQIHLPGIAAQSTYSTNQWGMRGDDPPTRWDEAFTIIAIGGSTTRDYYLDDSKTWPAVLEQTLQADHPEAWVGNAGLDGHSTYGHLVLMDDVIAKIRPDAIILLVGINDLGISFTPDNVAEYDQKRANPLTNSQLFNLLWRAKQIYWDGVYVVTDEGGYDRFTPQPIPSDLEMTPLPDDLRELLPSLPTYRHNLEAIIQQAQALDLQILLLTQPARFENTPEWESIWGKGFWIEDQSMMISAATWGAMLDIFNQELLAICQEQKILCYDLAANIAHSEENFYDFVHFTELGSQQVGQQVGQVVEQEWLSP